MEEEKITWASFKENTSMHGLKNITIKTSPMRRYCMQSVKSAKIIELNIYIVIIYPKGMGCFQTNDSESKKGQYAAY